MMQVNNFGLPSNMISQGDLSRLQVGQRLQVEILSNEANSEGMISLGGKVIRAKLEAQVQTGEKFWAAVKEANENGIILSRETLNDPKLNGLPREQIITLINRGVGFDLEISEALVKFTDSKIANAFLSFLTSSNPLMSKLVSQFLYTIPHWSKLNGSTFDAILKYYVQLGVEHEKSIFESLKSGDAPKSELASLKADLLTILKQQTDGLGKGEKEFLFQVLEEVTGQQLWLQTGIKKNAYCLIHLPLQDNGVLYDCQIAVESARKGTKMDLSHSRIALQVDTPNLGKVGADLMIYENRLDLCILHDNIEGLKPIIQQLYADTSNGFARIGKNIDRLTMKNFEDYPQFTYFLKGKHMSGVDIVG